MKAQCISAVEQAIGRSITVAESRTIEQRVEDAQVALARRDPAAWRALSKQDQLLQAAQYAAAELRSEALKKKQRIALTIQAHDRIENYTKAQVAAGHDETRLDALERMLAPQPDGKSNVTPVEYAAKGRMAVAMGQLDATWEAIKPRMMSFFANREAEAQLTRAVHGDTAGIQPEILKAARAWLDVAGMLRDSYVAAGGDVGRLDNWGMPHSWEPTLLLKRGKDRYVDDMMRWVDRRVYVHEDGQPYTDAEMREFLGAAWLTSVTDGANKRVRTDTPGGSIKANRHSQSRQLHFRDGAAALEALRTYSGRNLFESMVSHVRQMARDTALLEQFGPNADLAVDHFIQRIREEEARANPQNAAKFERRARRVENIYNRLAGNDPPPANEWIANGFSALRSIMSAAKLGSAPITSLADEGTMYLTAHVNNIPAVKVFLNEVRAFNPLDRVEHDMARRAGLMVGTMMDSVNRFGGDALGWEIPNRVSNAFMRISGLNAMTEARRRAFSVTMMDTIGTLTRNHADVSKLDPNDWRILRSKGITPADWQVWRAAKPDPWGGGHSVLTPDAIFGVSDADIAAIAPGEPPAIVRERAATKLLAVVMEEQDLAVIEPGTRERVAMYAGTQPGTFGGELARSFFQFKSFPLAVLFKHWKRGLSMYDGLGGKVGYLGTFIAATTLMGAVSMEINDIISGRDPRTLNPASQYGPRNWLAAFLKGGSLGIYGDFLFADSTSYGRTLVGAVGGPTLGLVEDVDDLVRGNIVQSIKGEETDFGAEALKFARGMTPGANLWYTKAVTDRVIFQQLQEYFSPGFLARQQQRSFQNYGTTYWWAPGESPAEVKPVNLQNIAAE